MTMAAMDPDEDPSGSAAYDAFAWFYEAYWSRGLARQFMSALEELLLPLMPPPARLLDLCCGTGQLAALLSARGYRVTGLDLSAGMLAYARRHAPAARFIHGDARTFDAPPTYEAVISVFDSLNHILSVKELTDIFRRVHRALLPGGRFFFDVNLERGFRLHWQESHTVVEDDKVCLVRGEYDRDARLGRYDFTLFRRHDEGGWGRTDFSILERCYTRRELRSALRRAGFRTLTLYAAEREGGLPDHAGRVFFLARKD